jgi:hypothetical protein
LGRMKGMEDGFGAHLIAARSAWIEHRKVMRALKRAARQAPAAAALAFESATEHLRRKASADLYYFGVTSPQARYIRRLKKLEDPKTEAEKEAIFYETFDHDRDRYEELAAQGFFDLPKEKEELLRKGPAQNFDEELGSTVAASQMSTYETARVLMSLAGEASRANGEGYYGPAVCDVFLETLDEAPAVFAGVVQAKWPGNPRVRERATASLAGWVGARLRLTAGWDLTRVLGEQAGDARFKHAAAFERLVGELSGAVAIEWAALEGEEPAARLVGRVEQQIIRAGDESARLQREGRLGGEQAEASLGVDEEDLGAFERRETAKQQLDALQGWLEHAKLSEQQRQVFEMDILMDHDAGAVARELGIPKNQVLQVRKNYRDKINRARRADEA